MKKMCLEICFSKFPYLNEYPIYIDGSNIAYFRHDKQKKPLLSDILLLYDYLVNSLEFKKENIYCICDPTLKYYIDKPIEYETLIKESIITEAPKVADEFILSFALKHDFCFIISNDRFRNYIGQLPNKQWLEERRIPFMIIKDEICLSPNIDYGKLTANDIFHLKGEHTSVEIATIEVLDKIEKSQGELDLF